MDQLKQTCATYTCMRTWIMGNLDIVSSYFHFSFFFVCVVIFITMHYKKEMTMKGKCRGSTKNPKSNG